VKVEKAAEGCDLGFMGGVGVDADRQEPAVFLDRSPELLRNPGQSAAMERRTRKTIG
jgi:hypothetical protein